MARDLTPADVLGHLEAGELRPVYLFYGENEFDREALLNRFRETAIPETARDFNLALFYADETEPSHILEAASSLPFASPRRLIIVRRTESLRPAALDALSTYLDRPVASTCLIFVSTRTDFRNRFYRRLREVGGSVRFKELSEKQVVPRIKRAASDLGLNLENEACEWLQQVVGNRLVDLYAELEKLSLYYGEAVIGVEELKKLVMGGRSFTIFELMDDIASRRTGRSLLELDRFLQDEDESGPVRLLGMLNRQIRLLWQVGSIVEKGGASSDACRELGLRQFQATDLMSQTRHWREEELEKAVHLVHQADGQVKSGAPPRLVLESLVLSLCSDESSI